MLKGEEIYVFKFIGPIKTLTHKFNFKINYNLK